MKHLSKILTDIEFYDKQIINMINDSIKRIENDEVIKNKLNKDGIQLEFPDEFKCPITCDIMNNPVIASDGHSYEMNALKSFLSKGNGKSPLTREKLNARIMIPNINLKKRIREHANDVCDIVEKCRKV